MPQSYLELLEDITASIPGVVYQFMVKPDGSWHFPYISKGIEILFEVSQEAACQDSDIMTNCIIEEDRPDHRKSVEYAVKNILPDCQHLPVQDFSETGPAQQRRTDHVLHQKRSYLLSLTVGKLPTTATLFFLQHYHTLDDILNSIIQI